MRPIVSRESNGANSGVTVLAPSPSFGEGRGPHVFNVKWIGCVRLWRLNLCSEIFHVVHVGVDSLRRLTSLAGSCSQRRPSMSRKPSVLPETSRRSHGEKGFVKRCGVYRDLTCASPPRRAATVRCKRVLAAGRQGYSGHSYGCVENTLAWTVQVGSGGLAIADFQPKKSRRSHFKDLPSQLHCSSPGHRHRYLLGRSLDTGEHRVEADSSGNRN